MKRFRARRVAVWCGLASLTLAAPGCAQIAGLSGDYSLSGANAGATAGQAGSRAGGAGRSGTSSGAAAGEAGADVGGASSEDAGAAGEAGSSVAPSAGTSGAGASGAGASGVGASGAGTSGAGTSGAGTSGAGASSAGASGAGSAGTSGASGASPVRVGFSEFHDSASGGDGASSNLADATFSKPAGTRAGDFILVFFGADHSLMNLSGNDIGGSGWQLIEQHKEYGTDGQATYLVYKIADGSESDPIVFPGINPAGGGDGVQGLLSVYRGVNALQPVNAYQASLVNTGSHSTDFVTATPAITTTVANCLLIAGLSPDTTVDRPVITAWPAGFTENQVSVLNPSTPHPDGWANIYSAERPLTAPGTLAASTFSWESTSGSDYYGSLAFVLALAPDSN